MPSVIGARNSRSAFGFEEAWGSKSSRQGTIVIAKSEAKLFRRQIAAFVGVPGRIDAG
jgi:hypothetical protein